jgi:hypothetical protein
MGYAVSTRRKDSATEDSGPLVRQQLGVRNAKGQVAALPYRQDHGFPTTRDGGATGAALLPHQRSDAASRTERPGQNPRSRPGREVRRRWPAVDHATVLDDMSRYPTIDDLRHFPDALVRRVDRDKQSKGPLTKIVGTRV